MQNLREKVKQNKQKKNYGVIMKMRETETGRTAVRSDWPSEGQKDVRQNRT